MANYIKYPTSGTPSIQIDFSGDRGYAPRRALWNAKQFGYPGGKGKLATNGASVLVFTVQPIIVGNSSESVDYVIWNKLDPLLAQNTTSAKKALLRWDMVGGYLECIGWMAAYNLQRTEETQNAVPVTIDFIVESYTWYST